MIALGIGIIAGLVTYLLNFERRPIDRLLFTTLAFVAGVIVGIGVDYLLDKA